jgi:hypothetical protein
LADTSRPSTAASLRPNSATWRARSAVPRDRSVIWLPTSVRSRSRIETALYRIRKVSAVSATIADSEPPIPATE